MSYVFFCLKLTYLVTAAYMKKQTKKENAKCMVEMCMFAYIFKAVVQHKAHFKKKIAILRKKKKHKLQHTKRFFFVLFLCHKIKINKATKKNS